ncbi:MAG: hypothetical protein ABI444_01405 [Candidatus Kapaibacterium sp.]
MSYIKRLIPTSLLMILAVSMFSSVNAMPNFARKYSLGCASCHTVVPKLNEFGFKFRSAGFRLPEEIGKDTKTAFNLGDYIGGRIQVNLEHIAQTVAAAKSGGATTTTNQNDLQFFEITLYPITGSLTKNLSSMVELSNAPEDAWELENAYVRYNAGSEENYFSARIGIFHPFEGYGAFDRPMGISRPIFQGGAPPKPGNAANNTLNKNLSTEFTPWGFDEVGAELGWSIKNTFLRGTVFNGIYAVNTDRGWSGQPAQGGMLTKPNKFGQMFDFQFTATQLLTEDGGGVSLYVYRGQADMPGEFDSTGTVPTRYYQNTFMRYALYASYPIAKGTLLGGYQSGTDHAWDATNHALAADDFKSNGWFLEANYTPFDLFGFGARYDYFTPSTTVPVKDQTGNTLLGSYTTQNAITAFVNYAFGDGLQLMGEYKNKTTKKGIYSTDGSDKSQNDNSFVIRLIWIQ